MVSKSHFNNTNGHKHLILYPIQLKPLFPNENIIKEPMTGERPYQEN